MGKGAKITLALVAAILVCAYLSLWMYSAKWFQREIDRLYETASSGDVEFLGPKPALENFPFVPEVVYTTGFKAGNAIILFPEMHLRGYPIPFFTLGVKFPKGISLDGITDPAIWSLDNLEADVEVPYRLPASFTYEDLAVWQESGGAIDVRRYLLQKQALLSEGSGFLTLDDDMQPVFLMEAVLRGHEQFIADQKDKGLIEPFPAAIGTTILNSLGKMDEKTGDRYVPINVSVKNRMLTVGPIQAVQLPEIVWDKRTTPVPPQ